VSVVTSDLVYTILVHNSGDTAVTGVQLTDTPDSHTPLEVGSVTTDHGTVTTGNNAGDATVAVNIGTLDPGATATLHYQVHVDSVPAGVTQVSTQSTVTSNELPPVLSDDPDQPGVADPTVNDVYSDDGGSGGGTTTGPTVTAFTPADGTVITEPVDIHATVTPQSGTAIANWALTARQADAPNVSSVTLASGNGAPSDPITEFDPTTLPNGTWLLTLSATGDDGGTTTVTSSLIVDGKLKLGDYQITYQDLSVPIAGIPIAVRRTYSTLNRNESGDFGYGWNLELANFRVQVNAPLGDSGWEQYQCGGGLVFVPLCYRTTRPHYVTVTWPDGHTEIFDFTPQGLTTAYSTAVIPAYTARAGSTSQLQPADADSAAGWRNDGNIHAGGFAEGGIYDPQQFILVGADGTRYTLDRTSGLIAATDRHGNTVTVDSTGVHSSLGSSIALHRDSQGRIDTVTGPDTHSVTYTYTPAGDLDTVSDRRGKITTLAYDGEHRLSSIDDPDPGFFRQLDYDESGRLVSITDASGATTTVDVDVHARTETATSPDGLLSTLSSFDERGNLLALSQIHDGLTRTTNFEFDGDRLIARTDPDGHRWAATYDNHGAMTSLQEPDGDTLTLTYDPYADLTSWTDGENQTTSYVYDEQGALTSMTTPDNVSTTFGYDAQGRMVSRTRPSDGTTTWTYNSAGRVATETTSAGTTTWTYDANGRVLTEAAPGGTTTWTYDNDGNTLTRNGPSGSSTWTYDDKNRVLTASDLGGTATFAYDDLGNLSSYTDAANVTTTWTYTGTRVDSETTPGGTTTWQYDGAGRQTSETTPDGTTTWTWDDRDLAETMIRPDNSVATFTWNDDGRINHIDDPSGGDIDFAWDHAGRLTSVVGPGDMLHQYSWDPLGHPTVTDGGSGFAPAGFEPQQQEFSPALVGDAVPVITPPAPPSFRPPLPGVTVNPEQRPPAAPDRSSRGGGGVLGEYAMLAEWAVQHTPEIGTAGAIIYETVRSAAGALSRSTTPEHRPPTPNEPDELPTPDTRTEPGSTDPPPPPAPPDICHANGNVYSYGEGKIYDGKPAATYAVALLNVREDGEDPKGVNFPGYRVDPNLERAHLIANTGLGGVGDARNIVMSFRPMNDKMQSPEFKARAALNRCESILVDVRPTYQEGEPPADSLWPDALPVASVHYQLFGMTSGEIFNGDFANTR
jgi:uncharacterized repeat protein (TIGR01451 family)